MATSNDRRNQRLVFQVGWGKMTLDGASMTLSAQVIPGAGECSVSSAVFPGSVLTKDSAATSVYAGTSGWEEHGHWVEGRYLGHQNQIVILRNRWTVNRSAYADGALLILLRDDASLLRINANVVSHPASAFNHRLAFSGFGHILSREEMRELGVAMRPNFVNNYLDQEEIDEVFDVMEDLPGRGRPDIVKVTDDEGAEKTVVVAPPLRRRITLNPRNSLRKSRTKHKT